GGCSHSSDMRTPAAVLSMLFRATTYPNVARSLCPRLVASPDQHRCVHVSPALSAKSLLHKFSAKSKKKPWYDSPSISRPAYTRVNKFSQFFVAKLGGSAYTRVYTNYKPHGLMSLMKVQQKENRGPNARIKILNSILYKALTGLLSTAEVCEQVFDLQIELSKEGSKEATSLQKKNIGDRLIFCKRYREWTAEDWGKSPFRLFVTSGKQLIRRRRATAPAQAYFVCPVEGRAKYCSAQAPGLCDISVAEDQKRTSCKEDGRRRSGPATPIRPDQQRDRPWRCASLHSSCILCQHQPAGKHSSDVTALLSGRCAHSQCRKAQRRGQTAVGYFGGLSTALQNAVDKPLMVDELYLVSGVVLSDTFRYRKVSVSDRIGRYSKNIGYRRYRYPIPMQVNGTKISELK
ncbi:unnamed protein product, partial [Ranitomeya imitator]